jgi:hypothetical protein
MPETCRDLQQNKVWVISASGWLLKKRPIALVKVTEMAVREVFKNGSLYTFIDDQMCAKTRRNL